MVNSHTGLAFPLSIWSVPCLHLRVIEGTTARALYATIIKAGWVSELSHAAYLGKELARAELALQYGFNYVQDGA